MTKTLIAFQLVLSGMGNRYVAWCSKSSSKTGLFDYLDELFEVCTPTRVKTSREVPENVFFIAYGSILNND